MAYLSPIELTRVAGLRPDVLSILTRHMAEAERRTGKKIYVPAHGGSRTAAEQQQLHAWKVADTAAGQVYATATPGRSFHEYGSAYDLRVEGGTDADYRILAAVGRELGMRAGADFKSVPADPFHFEVNESLAVAREKFAAHVRGSLQRLGFAIAGTLGAYLLLARWRRRRRRRASR